MKFEILSANLNFGKHHCELDGLSVIEDFFDELSDILMIFFFDL